jgi:hypothetical protein
VLLKQLKGHSSIDHQKPGQSNTAKDPGENYNKSLFTEYFSKEEQQKEVHCSS